MRPETKKRTPTGTKTRAAGIAMSETEQRKHKVTEEDKDCWRRTQIFFFLFYSDSVWRIIEMKIKEHHSL